MNKPSTTPSRVFLSYSRSEFYYAEALALQLKGAGLPIWFDVQQLNPGEDWQADIDQAIEESESMILLGSEAAFASPYVESEWRAFLAQGKPIYLAVYEPAVLPPDLKASAVVDLRGPFTKQAQRLAAIVKGAEAHHDSIPAPSQWALPKIEPIIQYVAFALLMASLIQLLWAAIWLILSLKALPEASVGFASVSVVIAGLQFRSFWRFTRRRVAVGVKQTSFQFMLYGVTSNLVWAIIAWSIYTDPSSDLYGAFPLMIGFAFSVVIGLPSLITIFLAPFSASMYRWNRLHHDLESDRNRWVQLENYRQQHGKYPGPLRYFQAPLIAQAETPSPKATYTLHAVTPDMPYTGWIIANLALVGNQIVKADEPADHHLVLVSNYSSAKILENLVAKYGTLTPIIITPVDKRKLPDSIGRFQWLDLREFDSDPLIKFGYHMTAAEGNNATPKTSVSPVFATWVFITKVTAYVYLLVGMVGWMVALGYVSPFIQSLREGPDPILFSMRPAPLFSTLLIVSGALQARLAGMFTNREMTLRHFQVSLLLLSLIEIYALARHQQPLLFVVVFGVWLSLKYGSKFGLKLGTWIIRLLRIRKRQRALQVLTSSSQFAVNYIYILAAFISLGTYSAGILLLAVYFNLFDKAKVWLPRQFASPKPQDTVGVWATGQGWRTLRNILFWVGLSTLLLVFIDWSGTK